MNWDDPVDRLRHIDAVGIDQYNKDFQQHLRDTTVATVRGYPIRPVSSRWGVIFMVDGAGTGFSTLERAKEYAGELPIRYTE